MTSTRRKPTWGARAEAWAETEEHQSPTYEEAIRRIGVEAGMAVLEVGCGSGVFLRLAADRGARAFGIDASPELIEIARGRVPEADLRVGDTQSLPYEDDSFDLVAGFNAFFFAADMVGALRDAGRVARPGASVLIQVSGRPERCDLSAMKFPLRPSAPAAAPPLWKPGVLEELAHEAGLTPREAFDLRYAFDYADSETLLRAMLSPAPIVEAIEDAGEERVRGALLQAFAPYRGADGGYRLENEWHYLLARA
jgi:SAM-dependent methyltransferase